MRRRLVVNVGAHQKQNMVLNDIALNMSAISVHLEEEGTKYRRVSVFLQCMCDCQQRVNMRARPWLTDCDQPNKCILCNLYNPNFMAIHPASRRHISLEPTKGKVTSFGNHGCLYSNSIPSNSCWDISVCWSYTWAQASVGEKTSRAQNDTAPELDQHWCSSSGDIELHCWCDATWFIHTAGCTAAIWVGGELRVQLQPQSHIKPTFRCVPVDEGVHQRPAFAIVGGSQLQPISFQGAHYLALPGNAHGECPLVILTGQWVQRTTAWSPGVEEDHQPQVWKEAKRRK